MKVSRTGQLVGLATVGALALSACGSNNNSTSSSSSSPSASSSSISCATGSIKGAGSTFQKNIVAQWIKDYTAACSGATVDYQGIGSGAGIKQFGAGTIDFAGSDSLMKTSEQADADKRCGSPAIHLPVTAGGIAIAYHLTGVTGLQLSPKTIAGIFTGKITKWDDAAIKTDNPSATLPMTAITAVHREDSSGTTDVVSKFLTATAGASWTLGTGKELKWPTAIQGAKGSDGVSQAVGAADGAIGYVEKSYVDNNSALSAAKVGTADGSFASLDGVTDAMSQAKVTQKGEDIHVKVPFAAIKGTAYPITAVSYEIVCTKSSDAAKQALIKSFLTYAVTSGQQSAGANGYAPLPAAMADSVKAAIATLA